MAEDLTVYVMCIAFSFWKEHHLAVLLMFKISINFTSTVYSLLSIVFVFKADSKEEEGACGSQPKALQKTDLYHLQKVGVFQFLPGVWEGGGSLVLICALDLFCQNVIDFISYITTRNNRQTEANNSDIQMPSKLQEGVGFLC